MSEYESVSERLIRVLRAIRLRGARDWELADLDATGPIGGHLTERLNAQQPMRLNADEMEDLAQDRGQIFELRADSHLEDGARIRLLIRDGMSFDILGFGDPPGEEFIGSYAVQEPTYFRWE